MYCDVEEECVWRCMVYYITVQAVAFLSAGREARLVHPLVE
jgi:hypothetical protein